MPDGSQESMAFETLKPLNVETCFYLAPEGTWMGMKSRWALLIAALCALQFGGCSSAKLVGATGTGFVWVATEGNQQVAAFSVNESNGAVSPAGKAAATGSQPAAMALTPDDKTLFIANTADGTINAYTVNTDGSLKAATGTTSTLSQGPSGQIYGQNPVAMAVDPGGKFLFVADQGQSSNANVPGGISVFSISGTSLKAVGPACPSGFSQSTCPQNIADLVTGFGTGPSALAVAPSGNFLYVANQFSDTVLGFSYDGNGNLTELPGQSPNPCGAGAPGYCVQTGANPAGLAFSRCAGISKGTSFCSSADGNNLFVANSGTNNISIFTACIQSSATCASADGSLTAVGSPVAAGVGPKTIIPSPELDFVYVVDAQSNEISQYKYSGVTGTLSPLSPAAVSTGISPFGGGITGDGSYFFVSNNNGSSMSVFKVDNTASTTGTAADGRLVPGPTASVALAGQPAAIIAR
jgi:6-phosphogluconolactonase (cycloisomerase 2 family)